MELRKKLNVGCGTDIKEGWINLDLHKNEGVDIIHDIEKLPLPFKEGSFDEILCQDVLEHVDYIPVLKDLHRILKLGGKLNIKVPHFTSANNFKDPTHLKMFSCSTFDFFVKDGNHIRSYYFDFGFSSKDFSKILFNKKKYFFINYFVEPVVNRKVTFQDFYETSFLCRIFPARDISVCLIK